MALTLPCLVRDRPNPSCRGKYTYELKLHGFTGRKEDFRVNHRGKENSFLKVTPGSVPQEKKYKSSTDIFFKKNIFSFIICKGSQVSFTEKNQFPRDKKGVWS